MVRVSMDRIEEEDYNLNISRHVSTCVAEDWITTVRMPRPINHCAISPSASSDLQDPNSRTGWRVPPWARPHRGSLCPHKLLMSVTTRPLATTRSITKKN